MITNPERKIVDKLSLTSPSLVLGETSSYDYYYYYKLYDLDGDGERNEFLILTYFSCNGNWVRVVRVDKDKHRLSTIPFKFDKKLVEEILVSPHKKDLIFNKGLLTTNSYNMVHGRFYTNTFVYKGGVFMHIEREVKK